MPEFPTATDRWGTQRCISSILGFTGRCQQQADSWTKYQLIVGLQTWHQAMIRCCSDFKSIEDRSMKTSRTVVAAVLVGSTLTGINWYAMADEPAGNGAVTITKVSIAQDQTVHAEEQTIVTGSVDSQESSGK